MAIDELVSHLDEWHEKLKEEHKHTKVKEAFEAITKFQADANINHLYNNLLTPAFEEMYKTLNKKLGEEFGDDTTKVTNKNAELKRVLTAALKSFFEKAMPSVAKAVEGMDDEDTYNVLVHHYGELVGHDNNEMKGIVEAYAGNKDETVGHVRRGLKEREEDYKAAILNNLTGKYVTHHLTHFKLGHLAEYIEELAREKGITIDDKAKLFTLSPVDLYQASRGINEGKWGTDPKSKQAKNPGSYGLKLGDGGNAGHSGGGGH